MDSEGKFWLGVWMTGAVTLLIVILLSTSYFRSENQHIVDMVVAGANPIAATCALQDSMGTNPTCVALIAKGN